ncbi:hypothetical protein EIP91_009242 [Steccherinum ochraceum]|uniref:Uncharacterized protein n=1 Tax=Steccherinum ochraceum TaxID=92696 RepID=A0A4V6N709_9APHY|nr:hypothetical protein EIP91_009242 [Steccherinum ochraceum]
MTTRAGRILSPVLIHNLTPYLHLYRLWQPVRHLSRLPRSQARPSQLLIVIVIMRVASVLAGLLVVATSSAIARAVPLYPSEARGYDDRAMVARDHQLAARDILQAIHARELAALDARTTTNFVHPVKRNPTHSPSTGGGNHNPSTPAASGGAANHPASAGTPPAPAAGHPGSTVAPAGHPSPPPPAHGEQLPAYNPTAHPGETVLPHGAPPPAAGPAPPPYSPLPPVDSRRPPAGGSGGAQRGPARQGALNSAFGAGWNDPPPPSH